MKLETKLEKWLVRIVIATIIIVVLYNAALEWKWHRENKRSEQIELQLNTNN